MEKSYLFNTIEDRGTENSKIPISIFDVNTVSWWQIFGYSKGLDTSADMGNMSTSFYTSSSGSIRNSKSSTSPHYDATTKAARSNQWSMWPSSPSCFLLATLVRPTAPTPVCKNPEKWEKRKKTWQTCTSKYELYYIIMYFEVRTIRKFHMSQNRKNTCTGTGMCGRTRKNSPLIYVYGNASSIPSLRTKHNNKVVTSIFHNIHFNLKVNYATKIYHELTGKY